MNRNIKIGLGTLAVLAIFFCSFRATGAQRWTLLAAASVCQFAVLPLGEKQQTSARDGKNSPADFSERTADASTEDAIEILQQELRQREEQIHQRERSLTDRWLRYRELFELQESPEHRVEFKQDAKITEKDAAVHALLEQESQRIFERVRANEYSVDGKFDIQALANDVVEVMTQVARIYSPDTQQPLLETSINQLAQAVSRMALHLLIVVEQLPLDVKDYNINSMHTWIRRAIRSYGAYKTAAPWMSWLSRTAYVGRFAAGANPVTLGAWWAATEIGKRGAGLLVEKTVDRQAIALFHDLIRVVGFEFAGIYGGDFRHRDANWIYGTELTALISGFPPSHRLLSETLAQVAELPLRNEYDRVYLYRCLASRKPAQLMLNDPALLDRPQREQIARQLERLLNEFVHGQTNETVTAWQDAAEQRLDVRLRISEQATTEPVNELSSAVKSLRAFAMLCGDEREETATQRFQAAKLWAGLSAEQKQEFSAFDSSLVFEPPPLDPDSSLTQTYLDDLVRIATWSGVSGEEMEMLATEMAAYFRIDADNMRARFQQAYQEALDAQQQANAPSVKLKLDVLRSILRVPAADESVAFVYEDATSEDGQLTGTLLGINTANQTIRLAFVANGNSVWEAHDPATARVIKSGLTADCELTGGQWQPEFRDQKIIVNGSLASRFSNYFEALLDVCRTAT